MKVMINLKESIKKPLSYLLLLTLTGCNKKNNLSGMNKSEAPSTQAGPSSSKQLSIYDGRIPGQVIDTPKLELDKPTRKSSYGGPARSMNMNEIYRQTRKSSYGGPERSINMNEIHRQTRKSSYDGYMNHDTRTYIIKKCAELPYDGKPICILSPLTWKEVLDLMRKEITIINSIIEDKRLPYQEASMYADVAEIFCPAAKILCSSEELSARCRFIEDFKGFVKQLLPCLEELKRNISSFLDGPYSKLEFENIPFYNHVKDVLTDEKQIKECVNIFCMKFFKNPNLKENYKGVINIRKNVDNTCKQIESLVESINFLLRLADEHHVAYEQHLLYLSIGYLLDIRSLIDDSSLTQTIARSLASTLEFLKTELTAWEFGYRMSLI